MKAALLRLSNSILAKTYLTAQAAIAILGIGVLLGCILASVIIIAGSPFR